MRRRPLSLVTLVMVLLTAAPATVLAAEEPAPVAETPAAEAPPPSTGWVPQDAATEDAGSTSAPAQRGSSLGSGGSSNPAPPADKPSASPAPPPPVAAPTDSYEPEPSSAPLDEESAGAPEPATEPAPASPPVTKVKPEPSVPPALGAADAVARPASSQTDDVAATAEPVASTSTQGSPDSGGLPWLALILCGLILLYAGARLLLGPVEPEFFRSGRFRFVRRVFPGA